MDLPDMLLSDAEIIKVWSQAGVDVDEVDPIEHLVVRAQLVKVVEGLLGRAAHLEGTLPTPILHDFMVRVDRELSQMENLHPPSQVLG